MLFAIKFIFDAVKSSAFTVGLLEDFVLYKNAESCKKQKVRMHFRCSVSFIQNTNVAVASVFAALLLFIFIFFSLIDLYL